MNEKQPSVRERYHHKNPGDLKDSFKILCVWFYSFFLLFKDIIQLHISCPSDKEEEKSTKDVSEKEDKDKNKEKVPRKMLSRGKDLL